MIFYANAYAYQKYIFVDTANIGISYDISGGDLVRASLDRAGHTLYLTLEKTSDGVLSVTIPDGLIPVDMSHGEQPAFSIMVGRNEANFKVQGNSMNIPFHKGDTSISITETPIIPLDHSNLSQSDPMINSDTATTQQSQISTIPKWIKNNAKLWSEGQIDDTDFIKGIQYLVQQKIIQIPTTQVSSSSSQSVPQWIKESVTWWANGQLSDHEFIQSIQWLIQQNIVVIPPVQKSSQQTTLDDTSANSTPSPSQQIVFSPCPTVDITIPSDCLGSYLPKPSDIGQQWTSQDGQSIPLGVNPSPMITQYVHQDFENYHTNPEEVFDVWVEEWQSPNCTFVSTTDCSATSAAEQAFSAFKSEETSSSVIKNFHGNPQSNDISFYWIQPSQNGLTTSGYEAVVGSVIIKIEGIGDGQNSVHDMGTIMGLILENIKKSIH